MQSLRECFFFFFPSHSNEKRDFKFAGVKSWQKITALSLSLSCATLRCIPYIINTRTGYHYEEFFFPIIPGHFNPPRFPTPRELKFKSRGIAYNLKKKIRNIFSHKRFNPDGVIDSLNEKGKQTFIFYNCILVVRDRTGRAIKGPCARARARN